jgi:hypothetical protein
MPELDDDYPLGEYPPIQMGQFTTGKRYGPLDLARICDCQYCKDFLARHEQREPKPFVDQVTAILESSDISVTLERFLPAGE